MKHQKYQHKALLHCHSNDDPEDRFIRYSTKELIDGAAGRGTSILSLTSHRKVIFNEDYRAYAQSKGILMIPGIEARVEGGDVGIINAHADADHLETIADLREYREKHPESFIYAPHPFFPGPCLREKLVKNIDLFDGIELSHFFHKYRNYNKPAEELAKKYDLPFFATPDCHFLTNIDIAYAQLNLPFTSSQLLQEENPELHVISALKNHQFTNFANPLSIFKISKTLLAHFLYGNAVNLLKTSM